VRLHRLQPIHFIFVLSLFMAALTSFELGLELMIGSRSELGLGLGLALGLTLGLRRGEA